MIVELLDLAITRNCPLYCEHCLRGNKECVNMNLNTLENVFKDIKGVNTLILTGGEPLIAINQLEKVLELLKTGEVKINNIRIITNGTVMSERIFKVLTELSRLVYLDLMISDDIFHLLEIQRLGMTDLRNRNVAILIKYFGARMYASENQKIKEEFQAIVSCGRAKTLSSERLAEINQFVDIPYILVSRENNLSFEGRRPMLVENVIYGDLIVDVNGNITEPSSEYAIEDELSSKLDTNLNKVSLKQAVGSYIEYKIKKSCEEEKKLNKAC